MSFTYEITGKTIGPLGVDRFLTEFLPGDDLVLTQLQLATIKEKLQQVATTEAEAEMYTPWVSFQFCYNI